MSIVIAGAGQGWSRISRGKIVWWVMKNKDFVLWILSVGLEGHLGKKGDWLRVPPGNLSSFSVSRTAEVSLRVKDHLLSPSQSGNSNQHFLSPPIEWALLTEVLRILVQ